VVPKTLSKNRLKDGDISRITVALPGVPKSNDCGSGGIKWKEKSIQS
jgi:hypothetical protein